MKKLKILSIDDSRSVHAVLRESVSAFAEAFDTALNGEEGLKKLQDPAQKYDLVFLDWEMPVKDGPTTFRELRALGIKTPVLMLTSKNDPKDMLAMLDQGVHDYILKPFTPDIILEKVQSVFR